MAPDFLDFSKNSEMIYVFATFELDTAKFELRNEGTPLDVEPQVFSIIQLLIENRHRMVSNAALEPFRFRRDHIRHAGCSCGIRFQ